MDDDGWDDVEIDVRHTKRRNVIHLTWKAMLPSRFVYLKTVCFIWIFVQRRKPNKPNILMWWRSCRWWRYCRDQDGSHALRKHEQLKCHYLFNVFRAFCHVYFLNWWDDRWQCGSSCWHYCIRRGCGLDAFYEFHYFDTSSKASSLFAGWRVGARWTLPYDVLMDFDRERSSINVLLLRSISIASISDLDQTVSYRLKTQFFAANRKENSPIWCKHSKSTLEKQRLGNSKKL